MIEDTPVLEELQRFARLLATRPPVEVALRHLAGTATVLLGIDGAGVVVRHAGHPGFAAATSQEIADLEREQARTRTGPGVEALETGHPVLLGELSDDGLRRCAVLRVAMAAGFVSVASIPFDVDAETVGSLDLYARSHRDWAQEDLRSVGLLATMAGAYLVGATELDALRRTADQLQHALDSRVLIEQAKGVLAGDLGIDVDDAFQRIRRHARDRGLPLREVATAVVHRGLRPYPAPAQRR